MEQHHAILKQQEEKNAPNLLSKHNTVCRQMQFGKEAPLYLAKSHWTNRFDENRASTIGIFFSIWVTPKLIEQGRCAYNIHSKQLSKLPGYRLTPRKFADEFRFAVEARVADWPGIRMDYGPSTLLQGHDSCDLDSFAEKVEDRVSQFVEIHKEIDVLLDR